MVLVVYGFASKFAALQVKDKKKETRECPLNLAIIVHSINHNINKT